jgi:CheY-like chemotaxis protein
MSVPAALLSGRCILVVEDEYLIASEVEDWLQAAGFEVLGPVPSAEQALNLIEDRRPDAAVLDIRLCDDATAYPVADKLTALGVPYLFATGVVPAPGIDSYSGRPVLEKPFGEEELLRTLADLLTPTSD